MKTGKMTHTGLNVLIPEFREVRAGDRNFAILSIRATGKAPRPANREQKGLGERGVPESSQ